jgi:hypothetical protein
MTARGYQLRDRSGFLARVGSPALFSLDAAVGRAIRFVDGNYVWLKAVADGRIGFDGLRIEKRDLPARADYPYSILYK